jgi:transposase
MSIAELEKLSKKELAEKAFLYYTELNSLKRQIFGRKSERHIPEPQPENQLTLFDLEESIEIAKEEIKIEEIAYKREKTSKKKEVSIREEIPAHIPVEEIILEPKEEVPANARRIGEDVTTKLDYIPGKLIARKYIRPKYAVDEGEYTKILQAPPVDSPIKKGIPEAGLITKIIIDKYVDHMPEYRQNQHWKREGVYFATSSLNNWTSKACKLIEPLYKVHLERVLSSNYIQADETPIQVLDSEKPGSSHRGYYWLYCSPEQKNVLVDYRPSRGGSGPIKMLLNYKGWLQTDGYTAYEQFESKQGIKLLGCLAHIRRYFEKALDENKSEAEKVLHIIRELYKVEKEARDKKLSAEERKNFREEKATSFVNQLEQWAIENQNTFLPKSLMGKAVHYLSARMRYTKRYLQDGKLEIDNNLIENTIRPIAIGRKNYLFAGSHEGARRAAMMYSLLLTCKRHEINPYEWLKNTLAKIQKYPIEKIEDLLPENFAI